MIKYTNSKSFYLGIAALVMHGLTFEADYDNLTIKLLGGF
jgi:hypothetical protein|tara:strand:- start:257 stop:376 length:120 start_codon:yes stop_codon:yes gene_type:complete